MMQSVTIETVFAALTQAFSGLDAMFDLPLEELERRPEHHGAWSLAEHLEHVCLANGFLLLTISKGCGRARRRAVQQRPPEAESDLELLSPIATPDAFDWQPPAHMVPSGQRHPAELRRQLRSQHAQCKALLDGMPSGEGRLCTIRMSVQGLGRLDMYQWLYFLAQHARYHLAMIARLRGA
jgi:hypothetical protein